MQYINPFSLLPYQPHLPLSEQELEACVIQIRKACQDVDINLLDTLVYNFRFPKYQELYLKVYNDKPLHLFLLEGDLELFKRQGALDLASESKGYLRFWKKFFVWRFNIEAGQAYFDRDIKKLDLLQRHPFDFTDDEVQVAYADIKKLIEQDLIRLGKLESDYKEKWLNSDEVLQETKKAISIGVINKLPSKLSGLKEAIAYRLLDLSILVYNDGDSYSTAALILEMAQKIDIGVESEDDLYAYQTQLKEYTKTAYLLEEYKQLIEQHLTNISSFQEIVNQIEKGDQVTLSTLSGIVGTGGLLETLHEMPSRFHFFGNEYYKGLRIFSAHAWNMHGDSEEALRYIEVAEKLPIDEDRLSQLQIDKADLKERSERFDSSNSYQSERAYYNRNTANYEDTGGSSLFIPAVIIGLALLVSIAARWEGLPALEWPGLGKGSNTTIAETGNPESRGTSGIPSNPESTVSGTRDDSSEEQTIVSNSVVSQLETGDSPYQAVFGKGKKDYSAQSFMRIRNDSGMDAVICLKQRGTNEVVRNKYLKNGETITITNVPSGDFELMTFYGIGWNENISFSYDGKTFQGGFLENFFLVEGDGGRQYWEMYDVGGSFTSYRIELKRSSSALISNIQELPYGLLSWNLNGFGRSVEPAELDVASSIISKFDVAALQELHINEEGANVIELLTEKLNSIESGWSYAISDPISNIPYRSERYAFVWKSKYVVPVGTAALEESLAQTIISEPFTGQFEVRGNQIVFANFCSKAVQSKSLEELKGVTELREKYSGQKLIIATTLKKSSSPDLFKSISGFGYHASPRYLGTELRATCSDAEYTKLSSNFILSPNPISDIPGSGLVDFVESCEGLSDARKISDYLPVWIKLDTSYSPVVVD